MRPSTTTVLPLDPGIARDLDGDLHVSRSVMEGLLAERLTEEELRDVRVHLRRCSDCRESLGEHLQRNPAQAPKQVSELLRQTERWARMAAAGKAATRDARASLHEKGINPVLMRDGELMEELPDGTIRLISEVDVHDPR